MNEVNKSDCKKDIWGAFYKKHIFRNDNKALKEQQKLCMDIYYTGAYGLWLHLYDAIVRDGWQDTPGYPLKREFYDNGKLACSMPREVIQRRTGLSIRQIKKHIKLLKDVGWIRTDRSKTDKGQNVYILGVWEEIKEENKTSKKETLFEHLIKEGNLESPCLKNKETGIKDLSLLPEAECELEMRKTYGDFEYDRMVNSVC